MKFFMFIALLKKKKIVLSCFTQQKKGVFFFRNKKGVVVGVQASSGQPNPALWFQLPKNQTSIKYIYSRIIKARQEKPGTTTTDKNHCFQLVCLSVIG